MSDRTHAGVTMKNVRPFWGRVSLIETLVEEETRDSGLVVPLKHDGSDDFKRGVVLAVDNVWDENTPGRLLVEQLVPGTVVFYKRGTKIGDVIIVDVTDILAFEADPDE